MLVLTSVIVTVTPGSTAPDVSVTLPTSEPFTACAPARAGQSTASAVITKRRIPPSFTLAGHHPARPRVARIPVEHQRLLTNHAEQPAGFGARRRVARQLVLERERDALPADLDRRLAHAIVDRFSVRRLIVEAPEIEDANVSRVESPGEVHGALDQLVLLLVGEVGAELRVLGAERRFRRAGPVGLEDWRCDLRDAQVVLRENGLGFGDVMRVPAHDVLVVHRTKLDQPEAELARRHFAGAGDRKSTRLNSS